jgi:hypothetical protein
VIGAAADLVHADEHQPVRPGVTEATTRSSILPTDSHAIRISFVTSVWDICCASRAHRQCSLILKRRGAAAEQTGLLARTITAS